MNKKVLTLAFLIALLVISVVPALADGPNFGPAIYADDQVWGTKGTADLPAPNGNNSQSYDGLFRFTNGVEGQLAVAEAAPNNPNYNGGRWIAYDTTWVGTPELVTSYDQLMDLVQAGELTITESGDYFQCPLLPTH